MKIVIDDRNYSKLDKSTQKVIEQAAAKLQSRYEYYGDSQCIFNDDILVHDIIRKKYFVYKCRIDRIQLRILYLAQGENLIIVSSYIKKKNNKEYIGIFEKAACDYDRTRQKTA